METIIAPPKPAGIATSLQSLGYTPVSAIADIIDNSIDADATHINVKLALDLHGQVIVQIADNGIGMNKSVLVKAMTYADGSKDSSKLGRFGLGLKTASTSMANLLRVVSSDDGKVFNSAFWDIDEIREKNAWVLNVGEPARPQLDSFKLAMRDLVALGAESTADKGTLIIWEKTFGVIKGRSGGAPANPQKAMETVLRKLIKHLSITFQRFVDHSDKRARDVVIAVNDEVVEAWDPFCTAWADPEDVGGIKQFKFESDDGSKEHSVGIRTFILPDPSEIVDDEYGSTVGVSLDSQGIYLYRNQRLIEGPDWFGIGKSETHLNRLRVEMNFDGILDDLFALDVTKSDAMLDIDPQLQQLLTDYLGPLRREADQRSRAQSAKKATQQSKPVADRPTEITIGRNIKNLDIAEGGTADDGSIVLTGNHGTTTIIDSKGKATGQIAILPEDENPVAYVQRQEELENGALWKAAWAKNQGMSVILNTGHPWYQKAYMPNAENSPLVQAIEYLFFALAQAEYNNSSEADREAFESFRVDVSRNLQKLVRHLPEPTDD
jgi:hypothetical protein